MAPERPTKLGRYEILEELGKGAMGVVYLAHDPLIGRAVALKTLRSGFLPDDDEVEQFRTRFIREAQSAGILNHPGIVTVHDVVERSEEGATFIAMEYVEGTDLKQILRDRARLDLRTTVDIIGQLADALDYAHSRGVVHRDVKPANVILTNRGEVKITDFGIARVNTSNLTQDGQLLGTPNYMAPEQVQGKEVDHRADIFSLGVVMYETLTGHKPFQGDNLTVVSHRIVYDEYTPHQDLVRGLPPGVDEVLGKALAKRPADRYQTCGELAADLRLLILDSGVIEVPAEARPEAPKPVETDEGTEVSSVAESLNDTQDLSDSLPPSNPQLNQTLASRPGMTEHDGDSTRIAAAGAPEATPPPIPTAAPESRPRRWWLVAAAALLLVVVGLTAVFFLSGAEARRATARRAEERQAWNRDLDALLTIGRQALAEERGIAALDALEQAAARLGSRREVLQRALAEHEAEGDEPAVQERREDLEQLAAQEAVSTALRQQAEWQVEEATVTQVVALEVSARLEAAHRAVTAGDLNGARAAVQGVLEIDPRNETAWNIARQTESALAAAAEQRRRTASAALPPPPEPSPEPVVPPPPEPVVPLPTTATLEIVLESRVSRGVLIIYFGEQQLVRENFRFGSGGLFRRSETEGGTWRRSETVDAGTATLRIFVTSKSGQPAEVRELTANFLGGSARTLRVVVDRDGEMEASLH